MNMRFSTRLGASPGLLYLIFQHEISYTSKHYLISLRGILIMPKYANGSAEATDFYVKNRKQPARMLYIY